MAKLPTKYHMDYEFEYCFSTGGEAVSRHEEDDYLARYSIMPGRAAGSIDPAEPDTVEIGNILRYEPADPFSASSRGEPVAVDEALRDEISDWLIDHRQEDMISHANEQMLAMREDHADALRELEFEI